MFGRARRNLQVCGDRHYVYFLAEKLLNDGLTVPSQGKRRVQRGQCQFGDLTYRVAKDRVWLPSAAARMLAFATFLSRRQPPTSRRPRTGKKKPGAKPGSEGRRRPVASRKAPVPPPSSPCGSRRGADDGLRSPPPGSSRKRSPRAGVGPRLARRYQCRSELLTGT
jgi:hypothetical protein